MGVANEDIDIWYMGVIPKPALFHSSDDTTVNNRNIPKLKIFGRHRKTKNSKIEKMKREKLIIGCKI